MRLNIFRNPHIDSTIAHMRIAYEENMRKETEQYWRSFIAREIAAMKNNIDAMIPVSETEVTHGEHILRHWSLHIINECERIARDGS